MKSIAWIAFVFAVNVSAEIELKISNMDYKWGSNADFPLEAVQIGYTYYLNDYGFKLLAGESNKRKNALDNRYREETQKMKRFFVGNIHKRFYLVKGLSCQLGINYTEYLSCSDLYGCNPDTGIGYGVAIQKRFNDYAVKLSYDDLYTKQHKTLGKEITRSTALSLVVDL